MTYRLLRYVWASPNTLVGAAFGLVWLCLGARARVVQGALEIHGGTLGRLMAQAPPRMRFVAITLGHVIIGLNAAELARVRRHEHVHLRQSERWGLLFFPAYLLSSVWQLLQGRRFYRDNAFERQAYDEEGPD